MENIENNQNQENKEEVKSTSNVDYAKLEDIINKGIQQKESSILKSYFQQMGMEEEELKKAVESYKENKAKKEEEKRNNNEELNKELDSLKKELHKEKLNNLVNLNAYSLGLDSKSIKAISKLADFENVEENGVINEDKIKASINKVLEDYPGLKTISTSENSKIVEVGAPDGDNNQGSSEDLLRKAFGLSPKKIK